MFSIFRKKKAPEEFKVNGITVRSAEELLKPVQHIINQIQQATGLPQEHWNINYLGFITNFANKVQLLPASESHHHSSYGGLLEHSLETGLNALKLKRAKMLPIGATAEIIEKEKELWNYAVFTSALLHDVGKPLSDQIITIVNETPARKFNPVTENLTEGSVYQLKFRRGRKYRSHENLPLLLASSLIPKIGLNWITSNPNILDEWTLCLTGRKAEAEAMGEIITKADQISTAQNLTGNTNIATPAAKTTPLHKRLITALIYLLDHDELPLNRQGAAGWVYEEKLWLVSKRAIDAIRVQMREEGQTGIPADNSRIMDELTQHNIIQPTDNDLAVWKMKVSVGSWKNEFTLLCFPLHIIWSDQTAWPPSLDNITVKPIDVIEKVETPKDVVLDQIDTTKDTAPLKITPKETTTDPLDKDTKDIEQISPDIHLDLPLPPGIEVTEIETAEVSDIKSGSLETEKPIPRIEPESKTHQEKEITLNEEKKASQHQYGEAFIDWLSNGISDGSITINQQQAMTHTIGENKDLILVSPRIFRVYAKKRNLDYREVQRDFQALGVHSILEGKNIWSFKTLTKRSNKDSGKLNGMLIEKAENILKIRLPPSNTHIEYNHKY